MPGHTPGGICILIREDRLLITGDSINRHLWMQLKGCTSLRAYAARLEAIRPVTERADLILHGHASGAEPISLFDDMLRGVKEVAEGHTEEDTDYQWFGGTARQHRFAENSVIVYDPALQE